MASVFVIENDVKDSVKEYGQIVDAAHQNTSFSDSLKPYFADDEITNKGELASTLFQASTKDVLGALSDKEFEPAFYLLVYLLSELEGTPIEQLVQKDSKVISLLKACTPAQQPSLRDRRSLKPATILSILNTFFNYVSVSSPVRISLVQLILNIVADTQINFALIQSSVGDNLIHWLQAAGASEEETKAIFWSFISLDSAYTMKSLELIKAFTAQFTLSKTELHQLIKFALSSSVVDVSFLVNNNVAAALQQNAGDELAQTFVDYTRGNFIASVPSLLPQETVAKSKILALTRFFVENDNQSKTSFKYSDIPSELVSSISEFEKLLIDSIKAGVIEGKLNQVDETFYLVRVNRFVLAGDNQKLAQDWETVKKALLSWKHSLDNINEIVLNAKENIVNNNNAN